jgi:hypothetical protein
MSILLIAFAVVFVCVGVIRVVEFGDLGLKTPVRIALVIAHLVGCLLFACAISLLGIDVKREHMTLMSYLLFPGLGILLPVHIYLGLKRRIKTRQMAESPKSSNNNG